MSLPEWLLSTLACPRCKGELTPLLPTTLPLPPGEGRGEGIRPPSSNPGSTTPAELYCPTCSLAYPIRNGVPELLPEASRPYTRGSGS
ncbi:Trm112 family protein [Archangium lansingense]|uniref:Trm112 family protein n=1 Tax=Archangium lansingense TaxID=2995310 RepID=UPI003B80171B